MNCMFSVISKKNIRSRSQLRGLRVALAMAGAPTDLAGTAAGESDVSALRSLLAICPFDPGTCTPKEFDFSRHNVHRPTKGPQKLPHRLLLSAFSTTVGHRPTGLQTAQAKMFVERFPTEFREISMQKVVLPCNMDRSLPFVAHDGCLPCPALSTFTALKYLQRHPKAMANADDRAKSQMEKIFTRGVQLEWIESESFLQWQWYVESSSVMAMEQVQPDIIDTALKYLWFRVAASSSKGQGESDSDSTLEMDDACTSDDACPCGHQDPGTGRPYLKRQCRPSRPTGTA